MSFPEVSSGLLKHLQEAFPDRVPRKECSMFELGRLAGLQEVIDLIETHHNRQQEKQPHVRR